MILSAGVGSGHNSAAAALKQACAARDDVDEVLVLDVLQESSTLYRDLLGKGYFALVDNVPWLVDWGYDVSDQPFRRRGPDRPVDAGERDAGAQRDQAVQADRHHLHPLPAGPAGGIAAAARRDRREDRHRHDRLRLPGAVAHERVPRHLRGAGRGTGAADRAGCCPPTAWLPSASRSRRRRQRTAVRDRDGAADAADLGRRVGRRLRGRGGAADDARALAVHRDDRVRTQRRAAAADRAAGGAGRRPVPRARLHRRRCRSCCARPTCSSASRAGCPRPSAWPPGCRWCS